MNKVIHKESSVLSKQDKEALDKVFENIQSGATDLRNLLEVYAERDYYKNQLEILIGLQIDDKSNRLESIREWKKSLDVLKKPYN